MSKTYYNEKSALALALDTYNSAGSVNGEIIDMQGFESGKLVHIAGTITAGTMIVADIYESDDSGMSGATAIPTARLFGTKTAISTSDTVQELGFIPAYRYVRVTFTKGTGINMVAGATIEKGQPHYGNVQA